MMAMMANGDGGNEPARKRVNVLPHVYIQQTDCGQVVSQQNGLNVRHILLRTHHNATHSKWHFYLITAFRRLVRLILMR